MAKYFISHSSKDKEIVNEFLKMLKLVVPISDGDIFCTSMDGNDIPVGKDFVKTIKKELSDAKYVFACFSQCYFESQVCMAELGASWIKEDIHVIPIIIDKNFSFESMTPLFRNIQGISALDKEGLNKFFDDVIRKEYSKFRINKWEVHRNNFLTFIKNIEPQKPDKVPYSSYQNLQIRNNTLENENKKLKENVEFYKKESVRLSKAETQEEKDEILREYNQDTKSFDKLLKKFKTELAGLPKKVQYAVYLDTQDMPFPPQPPLVDIRRGLEYGYLKDDGEGYYSLNKNHPKIKDLLEDLETLERLESSNEEEYSETYGELYFTNRKFWEDVFEAKF